jgi:hypothetical protein
MTFLWLLTVVSGCAYLSFRYAMSIENCADSIAGSLSRELKKVQGGRHILVGAPVDAVTYSRSEFSPVFQEFLTSSMAKRLPHVVDVHFRGTPGNAGSVLARPLDKDEPPPVSGKPGIVLVSTYLIKEDMVIITTRAVDDMTREVITSAYASLSRSEGTDDLFKKKKDVVIYEK